MDALDAVSARASDLKIRVVASIALLREHRAALITAAVTGQIDVDEWSRRGTADRRLDAIQERMQA